MKLRVAALVSVWALLGMACGGRVETFGPPPSTGAARPSFPPGAGALVLRISAGGGLVLYDMTLAAVAGTSIYGDGSAVMPARSKPAKVVSRDQVVPLVRVPVDLARLSQLVQQAENDGLFRRGVSLDYPNVTDLPTTVLEVVTGDGRHRQLSAYALYFTDHDHQLPESAQRNRAAFRRFLEAVDQLTSGNPVPYQPERYSLYLGDVSADDRPSAGVPAPWPVGDLLAADALKPTSERCLVIGGPDALRLTQSLVDGSIRNAQVWTVGHSGALVKVVIRPLLPDQRTCEI